MIRESRGYSGIDFDAAEALAIAALSFLGNIPEELGRFLALSGLGPANLRAAAADPLFLAGVLDHLAGDESLLLSFAEQRNIPPTLIGEAARSIRRGQG